MAASGIELLRAFAEVRTLQLAKQMAQAIDLRERVVALADGGLALCDRSVTPLPRRLNAMPKANTANCTGEDLGASPR